MATKPVIGLMLQNQNVEFTVLREENNGAQTLVPDHFNIHIESPIILSGGENAAVIERAANAIREQGGELNAPASIGIPMDQTLMRVVDLPAIDPDEIKSMAQLQVDKFSPFSGDKTASSVEVLKVYATHCKVLIIATKRSVIEAMGAICKRAGVEIMRMDSEVMAWWRLLLDSDLVTGEGRQITVLLKDAGGIIIASQDSTPISFKSISPPDGLSEDEYCAEIAAETASLILSIDLEYGDAPLASSQFLYGDIAIEKIAARLSEELDCELKQRPLSSLPPISEGLARRMMTPVFSIKPAEDANSVVIDLVPSVWRADDEATRIKNRVIKIMAGVFGIWLVTMTILFIAHKFHNSGLIEAEQRMATLQAPADEARMIQRRVSSFEQYLDRSRSALECLREINQLLSPETSLTSFQFKKGKNVIVRGEAEGVEPIIDFKQQLDSSRMFDFIEMGAIQPGKRRNQTVQTFQMNARIPEKTQ